MRRNLYRHGGNSSSPRSQSSSSSLLLLLLIFIALLFSIDPSAAADVEEHWRRSAALVVSLDSHSRFTAVRRSSNEMYFVPPRPVASTVMGLEHWKHFLAKSSPKQLAQYGFSSLEVKRSPASDFLQLEHVKQSRWYGSFLYVTPPAEITF